jgi:putative Mg2+ transporter-C (MgtC) family protein
MDEALRTVLQHLLVATAAGGVIGLERSYHGRPAGFRTHTLVCLSSSLLMFVTLHQAQWFPNAGLETVRIDPTRMAQGVMTGIGFLGAGVIMKEGLSVRGLTTAASIWTTAAIGILAGVGLYLAAVVGTVMTLGILSVFRWVESKMPSFAYAHHHVRFLRKATLPEPEVRALIGRHGYSINNLSYRVTGEGKFFEYRMVIRTRDARNGERLAATLAGLDSVVEFRIAPTGD